jgi:hypothetical protein
MAGKKKAQFGDIVEINTPAGLAYLQYTHNGGNMGELVRVLPGLFITRPTEFAELAKQKELYFVFYTLTYSLRKNLAEIVSHQPVPQWAKPHPLMRWPGAQDQSGKTIAWKIFKASDPLTVETHQHTPLIRTLSPEQQSLSIRHLWPHPVMVRELARGWTPERAEELRIKDMAEAKASRPSQSESADVIDQPMRHYLYFPKKLDAETAGRRLRERGFSVEVRKGADGDNWLALATHGTPQNAYDVEELRDEMEALAAKLRGEYDGWEIATAPNKGTKPN